MNEVTKCKGRILIEDTKNTIEILEEIKKDYLLKFENDPTINRICTVMINEFKIRTK